MVYLQLLWSFIQIGLFSIGGGYAPPAPLPPRAGARDLSLPLPFFRPEGKRPRRSGKRPARCAGAFKSQGAFAAPRKGG